jgi:hypothetical protein
MQDGEAVEGAGPQAARFLYPRGHLQVLPTFAEKQRFSKRPEPMVSYSDFLGAINLTNLSTV